MQNPNQISDSELVKLSLKDSGHFGELVNRYEKKLFRYVKRFSGLDDESVQDVLQESFIKIYINLNDYNSDFSFSSWAYRITHNETVNYLKKNKKINIVPLENDDEEAANLIEVLKSEIDIEKEFSDLELRRKIQKTLYMLPGKYREVLILRHIEDLDYKEISDVLRMPMGTVATTINRAKVKFKKIAEKMHLHYR